MEGWSRSMYFDQTGLPFVMPSPNIPTLDSAIVYPGTVLFEGTNASEARGTTRPFELVGAPWVEAERFADDDERAEAPRRALPSGGVRADVPEAREEDVRRMPDSRARSQDVQAGADRRRADRRDQGGGPEGLRAGGSRPTNTSTKKSRSTSSPGRRRSELRSMAGKRPKNLVPVWERESKPFEEVRAEYLVVLDSLMATEAKVLDVTRTQLIQAPPARVMQAFFTDVDLKGWWQVTRAFTVARPLGMYAIEWESTDFKDEILGRLGGSLPRHDHRLPPERRRSSSPKSTGSRPTAIRSARWRSKCNAARTATAARRC